MITEILERIQHIDTLIQEHKTGTPAELAQTIGVSERTIYQYIRLMKKFGAPIDFNTAAKTYYYKEEGTFICVFSFSVNTRKTRPNKLKPIVVSKDKFLRQMCMNVILNKN